MLFDVRDMLMDKELVGLDTQNAKIIFGEISIDTLNSKPKLTKATIDFIKNAAYVGERQSVCGPNSIVNILIFFTAKDTGRH